MSVLQPQFLTVGAGEAARQIAIETANATSRVRRHPERGEVL